ncbi:hypothetical protein LOY43_03770 [Pseudomonas sp. B21-041]|uniref:hypothetical protein n=1 Tax=Pseudomonas sp. B21-041 TaxID=2895487 RepID=UPI00215EFD75|nr:hypothetical protein [Pseudomonas sp. B21-041]UVL35553.1 hypothetical protein LOY43_03770 [Pseudomonas sp. B21-041]
MNRNAHIEIRRMADAVEDMATQQFANDRSRFDPFETSLDFVDDQPDQIKLISEALRLSLSETYSPSRVHVSIAESHYLLKIDKNWRPAS